jgi:RNA polymerase sigma-70 factor (ECF subfamily)
LVSIAPSVGGIIARAAALEAIGRSADALASLKEMPQDLVAAHQPYWATLAHIEAENGDLPAALAAYDRAVGLCSDSATRNFLIDKRESLKAR